MKLAIAALAFASGFAVSHFIEPHGIKPFMVYNYPGPFFDHYTAKGTWNRMMFANWPIKEMLCDSVSGVCTDVLFKENCLSEPTPRGFTGGVVSIHRGEGMGMMSIPNISQQSSGVNSPNIVSPGNVTINGDPQ